MENVALLAAMTGDAQRYPRTGRDYSARSPDHFIIPEERSPGYPGQELIPSRPGCDGAIVDGMCRHRRPGEVLRVGVCGSFPVRYGGGGNGRSDG